MFNRLLDIREIKYFVYKYIDFRVMWFLLYYYIIFSFLKRMFNGRENNVKSYVWRNKKGEIIIDLGYFFYESLLKD